MSHAFDIAQVHNVSGTFVLPAHSPYDRQMVREHVERLAGRGSMLTLGMHGTQWTITRRTPADSRCGTCTEFLGRLRCSRGDDTTATCIDCAMQSGSDERTEGHDS